eukprot:362176-Chlamydomonas_euryale.AAC.2
MVKVASATAPMLRRQRTSTRYIRCWTRHVDAAAAAAAAVTRPCGAPGGHPWRRRRACTAAAAALASVHMVARMAARAICPVTAPLGRRRCDTATANTALVLAWAMYTVATARAWAAAAATP